MAKKKNGKLSGRIGNLIHYTRNGVDCVRSVPAHYHDANTPEQQLNRKKISLSGKFLRSFRNTLKIGFQGTEMDNYFNEPNAWLINNCFIAEGSELSIDFSKVKMARGTIPAPEECSMNISGNILEIMWRPFNKFERAFKSDHAVVLMYDSEGKGSNFLNAGLRSDSIAKIEIPEKAIFPIHVWMFFHNPGFNVGESKDKISDSVYLGMI